METVLKIWLTALLWTFSECQRWPLSGTCHPCSCKLNHEGYGRVKYVNCSYQSLNKIPRNLPLDLHTLDLSHNNILPQDFKQLCTFKAMQYAILSFNELVYLPKYSFNDCNDLLKLNLTGNKLTVLETETFTGIENIQGIYGLEVDEIMEDTFRSLTKLKTLELIYNGNDFSKSTFDGLSIQELKLTVNLLQTLPITLFDFGVKTLNDLAIIGPRISFLSENAFRGLAVLRKIYLDLDQLVSLPERIFHNNGRLEVASSKPQNLQEILIFNIASFPTEIFKDLNNLNKLVLHGIPSIQKAGIFSDLFNLEFLDITECNVNQIPEDWFSKLYSLKTLKLRHTGIRTMEPGVLAGLINLQELDVSFNVLRHVEPQSLEPLTNSIKTIRLHGNMLKTIDRNLFQNMNNLVALDISDNKLKSINKDAFMDLRQLIHLDMHDNKLSDLPQELFRNLQNLQTLNLGLNTFTKFPEVLDNSGYLLSLDFSNNRIIRLPSDFLESFPFLEFLNLNNNPLYCDCQSLEIKFNQPSLVILGTCLFPEQFAWRKIYNIEFSECKDEVSSSNIHLTSSSKYTQVPSYSVSSAHTFITTSTIFNITDDNILVDVSLTETLDNYGYFSTEFQPTPTIISMIFSDLILNTSTVFTPPSIDSSPNRTFAPPIFKEEKHTDTITDALAFRVAIGVVSGALFICGFVAVILWRKRDKKRNRYEVNSSTAV